MRVAHLDAGPVVGSRSVLWLGVSVVVGGAVFLVTEVSGRP